LVETGLQSKSLSHDGDEDVDRDGDPDLSLDGILAGAEEGFDAEMLFDPIVTAPAQTAKIDPRNSNRGKTK
jgi:hypothetical protein